MARQSRKRAIPRKAKKTPFGIRLKHAIRWPWFDNFSFGGFVKVSLVLGFWAFVLLAAAAFILSMHLPDINKAADMVQGSTVILRDDKGVEFAHLGDAQGEILKVGDMSPHLVKAVISIEDRRFYSHLGVDPIGLLRAVFSNLRGGNGLQGGSTITQQLAKNLFLNPERTLTRKAKEALLALYLERRYSKNEILAAYLNRAYFGAGAYGVDSAARVYFNTSARSLTLEQAAMLAGLLKAPTRYSPDNDPKLTQKRTRTVLGAMVAAGYLRPGAENTNLPLMAKREYSVAGSSDMRYFADWVMGQVEAYTGDTDEDLVVDTTANADLQRYAATQLRAVLDKQTQNVSQGALVTMQPGGAVLAMVGGRDYTKSSYNRATSAMRQPGSSFKIFTYLAALEKGYTPQTLVTDAPLKIGKYAPQNFDNKYRGTLPLQDAVANSLNTVAVRVASDVGVANVKNVAQRMGITEPLTPDLSLALGASEVHVLSLTSAYATLANNGVPTEPYGIKMIRTKSGRILYQRRPNALSPALSPDVVAQMNHILQGVITYGTGQRAMIDRPAAGKTGTSSDYHDAWFMGYTNDMVTGVWVGNDNNAPMKRVTGGSVPAQIWHDVMLRAEAGHPVMALNSYAGAATPEMLQTDGTAPAQLATPDNQPGMFEQLLGNLLGGAPVQGDPTPVQDQGQIQWDN